MCHFNFVQNHIFKIQDGLWTAPSSAHLRQDILLAKKLGFNGARLHQKVFEALYFAQADELGFLVFCESPGLTSQLIGGMFGMFRFQFWSHLNCGNHQMGYVLATVVRSIL